MEHCKNVQGITRKLETFLNIDVENITEKDINKILKLHLPIAQVDNLIKITNHTNESLEELKNNLVKNRNLMAEEISCLNECFTNTNYEIDFDNSNCTGEDVPEINISSSPESHSEIKDNESSHKSNVPDGEYQTRKFLLEMKNARKEVLDSPPMLDPSKFK